MGRFKKFGLTCGNFKSVDVGEKIFGGENTIQIQMEIEAALARVQAKLGIIPQEAADEITKKCNVSLISEEEYTKQFQITKHVLVCLIRAYASICENDAGKYLHYGATTQEIVDTATMMQLKQAYEIIEKKVKLLRDAVAHKAQQYRSLICIARTNGQQAMPVTLGFRIASWADELDRSIERMEQAKSRIFVGSFFGAVGTLASLKDAGLKIQTELLKEVGLNVPQISWYSSRDRLAELINILCVLMGTLGRIGNEVYVSSMMEIGEMTEEFSKGKVGSSTMPHKRNPVSAYTIVSNARLSRSVALDGLSFMENVDERDGRTLSMEYEPLAKICMMADATLDTAISMVSGLEVHPRNIERNLKLTGGLVFSEAIMMALSKVMGKLDAHEKIYEIAQKAISEKRDFCELLLEDYQVASVITKKELEELLDPKNYIGLSEYFTDRIVHMYE